MHHLRQWIWANTRPIKWQLNFSNEDIGRVTICPPKRVRACQPYDAPSTKTPMHKKNVAHMASPCFNFVLAITKWEMYEQWNECTLKWIMWRKDLWFPENNSMKKLSKHNRQKNINSVAILKPYTSTRPRIFITAGACFRSSPSHWFPPHRILAHWTTALSWD